MLAGRRDCDGGQVVLETTPAHEVWEELKLPPAAAAAAAATAGDC